MFRVAVLAIMIVALAILGGVALVLVRAPAAPEPVEVAAGESLRPAVAVPEILVTARRLSVGTLLRPEDIAARARPAGDRSVDMVAAGSDGVARLVGAIIRDTMQPDEPFRTHDFVRPLDGGFLAAVLAPGMRAVAISVDPVTGTGGLIWAGDFVDVIMTMTVGGEEAQATRRVAGETILRNVRVVAVDQNIARGTASATPNGDPHPGRSATTVTLEVSEAGANALAVASQIGHLSLSIRPVARAAGVNGEPAGPQPPEGVSEACSGQVCWGGDVSEALRRLQRPNADPEGRRLIILRGNRKEDVNPR